MVKTLRPPGRAFILGVILALVAPTARAQDSAGAGTWGFVNVRYDSRSSASIYTGYGWHRAFAMGGMLHNPRSGYAELLGGVGFTVRTGAADHWLAVASARAGGVSFAQVYWLPTMRMGRVTARANVKWNVAYEGRSPQKLTIAPVSITLPVGRRLAGGAAMDMAAAEGARTSVGMGPQLRLKLPRASLAVDGLRDVTGNGSRVRLFFASLF
jgi:hypothetical protein